MYSVIHETNAENIISILRTNKLFRSSECQKRNLKKGQGSKIISIPRKALKSPTPETLNFLKILPLNANLLIFSGRHFLKLSPGNQMDYTGMRGHRGKKLPRGYQNVDRVEIVPIEPNSD